MNSNWTDGERGFLKFRSLVCDGQILYSIGIGIYNEIEETAENIIYE